MDKNLKNKIKSNPVKAMQDEIKKDANQQKKFQRAQRDFNKMLKQARKK